MRFLALLLLLICPMIVLSQSQINLGVKVGLNYSNNIFQTDEKADFDSEYRYGYHIGIQSRVKLLEDWYLTPEISWNNRGYYYPDEQESVPYHDFLILSRGVEDSHTHLNYLTLPVLVEYRPIDLLGLQIGSEVSYLISAKSKSESRDIDVMNWWEFLGINRTDFGLIAGADFQLIKKLNISLRYVHGITSLYHTSYDISTIQGNRRITDQPKNLNRTFQLSITYFVL